MWTRTIQRAGLLISLVVLVIGIVSPQQVLAAGNNENPTEQKRLAAQNQLPGCSVPTISTFMNDTALVIPTGPATVTSTITVSGAEPFLWDLNLTARIWHNWNADLDITLTSPAGTVVTLTTDNGDGFDNVFLGTRWDDDADDPVTDHIFANLTPVPSISPEEPLAALIGENPNGEWILTIEDDTATNGGGLTSWSLELVTSSNIPEQNITAFSNTTPISITDAATTTSTITVAGADPYLWDLNLQTSIAHTFPADLDITLTSPAGTIVTITTDNGSYWNNVFNGTLWDDNAGDPVTDHVFASMNDVLASPLSSEEPLGAFIGEDPNGMWTLSITDDTPTDSGVLNAWNLDMTTAIGCPFTVVSTDPEINAKLTSLSSILVTFNQNAISGGTPNAADYPSNYLLIEQGKNGARDTTTCESGLAGDDIKIPIKSAIYDDSLFAATLGLGSPLKGGRYRLIICGTTSIWSVTQAELNYGLSDTVVDFRVLATAAAKEEPLAEERFTEELLAEELPATGFAPGKITILPLQPREKAYSQNDLVLEIPVLGVKTGILGVPLTNGDWDVSWLGSQAGWLEGSAFPTWKGNSVITGHVWNADNTPGIFAGLKKLSYGDRILVHAFGLTYTYEVIENERLTAASVKSAFTEDVYDTLTLLTCEDYITSEGEYSARRSILAVLIAID